MKKMRFFIVFAVIITVVGCQKELSAPQTRSVPSDSLSIQENGRIWAGYQIAHPPSIFSDSVAQKILFDNSNSDAEQKLLHTNLENSGPRFVYAVQSFTQGSFDVQRADLERRGWKVAPLSYLIALGNEYGQWNAGSLWNLFCVDIPVEINVGHGDESVAVSLNGNSFDPVSGKQYNMGFSIVPMTYNYGNIFILAYR